MKKITALTVFRAVFASLCFYPIFHLFQKLLYQVHSLWLTTVLRINTIFPPLLLQFLLHVFITQARDYTEQFPLYDFIVNRCLMLLVSN